ncbi:MAG: ThiF family adenylyltransferase [Bdellovibrio sp.]|nr:ThiF family adenylyltransferase [Bdellovibrio sp.]
MFERNLGYIDLETQAKLAQTTILFAGCGVGSAPAEAAARLGILNFILVDGDIVEEHNLNRQSFEFDDIGKSKVESLKKRILRINPKAKVEAIHNLVTINNARSFVDKADIVFDTIDFLDLEAIVGLHDAANSNSKPIVSLFTAGFGAVGIFVPAEQKERSWIRELFQLADGDLKNESYTEHFFTFFQRLAIHLNPAVQQTMMNVFQKMKDGIPCPAPHVVAGSLSAAALGMHWLTKYLTKEPIKSAPEFIYLDLAQVEKKLSFTIV